MRDATLPSTCIVDLTVSRGYMMRRREAERREETIVRCHRGVDVPSHRAWANPFEAVSQNLIAGEYRRQNQKPLYRRGIPSSR